MNISTKSRERPELELQHHNRGFSGLPTRHLSDAMLDRLFRIRHSDQVTVLAMGDSSVFGVGDYGDRLPAVGAGWTGRVAHDIGASRFINVARNGARARDLSKGQLKAAIAMRPSLALICIGTNDVLRGDFSPEEVQANLRSCVESLHKVSTIPVFLGLPDPVVTAPGPMALRRILNRRVTLINKTLLEVCRDYDAIFIATWHLPYQRKNWHVDRMHPSPNGHQAIASHVRAELSLLRKSKESLPTEIGNSKHFEAYWLMTNGLKWFLKRSIDLIPGLIWLIASDWWTRRRKA